MKRTSWQGSQRRSTLPKDWDSRRAEAGQRDGWRCQWRFPSGRICGKPGNQIDHITPSGSDELWNLRCLCEEHHKWKSSSEGGYARAKKMRELKDSLKRDPEPEPQEQFAPGVRRATKGF